MECATAFATFEVDQRTAYFELSLPAFLPTLLVRLVPGISEGGKPLIDAITLHKKTGLPPRLYFFPNYSRPGSFFQVTLSRR